MKPIMRIIDVALCVKKCFLADSVEQKFIFLINIEVKAIFFISSPVQMRNQCKPSIEIRVSVKILMKIIS